MKIFVINGSGGCGKDTFIHYCMGIHTGKVLNISTVDIIKDAAVFLGWEHGKEEKDRQFLASLKDLATKYYDAPFQYVKDSIEARTSYYGDNGLAFIHCREPKEIDRFVRELGAKTILIDASKRVPVITSNEADKNVFDYNYDFIIDNNGDEKQLCESARTFLDNI